METYEQMEENRKEHYNNGFFRIVYSLGQRIFNEENELADQLSIIFTPSLQEILGHHKYAKTWAGSIKKLLL